MKNLFIILIFCLLYSCNIFSQSSTYVLKTDIRYDSEPETVNLSENTSMSKSSLRGHTFLTDSMALLNFHEVNQFDQNATPFKSLYDISASSRLTVIMVFHSPDTSLEHGIWSVIRDGKQVTGLTDKRLFRQKSEYQYPVKRRGIPLINTSIQAFSKIRSKADSNHFVLGEAILPDSTLSSFSGNIAECLVFSRFLKKAEVLKIETYLAIKYGITLIASDYVSSSGGVLWSYEENKDFSEGIAGIGKDSVFGLDQKQSCSSEEVDLLTISVGNFSSLNKDNDFILPEFNYLVWGHNNNGLLYNNIACGETYPLMERKWLMQTTYSDTTDLFPTMLRFQLPEEYRDTSRLCYLVIDRSGVGDFILSNTEYIVQSRIDTSGYVYFDSVIWDTDGSGKDVFSFSLGTIIETTATVSCPNTSTGTITIDMCGGQMPFDYVLIHDSTNQEFTYQGGRNYTFENLSSGSYILTITDNNNMTVSQRIEVEQSQSIMSSVPLTYCIQENDNTFDAQDYFGATATGYVWEKDSMFFGDSASIDMSTAGKYKLSITDTNACVYTFDIVAEEAILSQRHKNASASKDNSLESLQQEEGIPQYKVYPNPTAGNYTIEIDLPKESPITIRVFTAGGSLLSTKQESGRKRYFFEEYLLTTGNYIIEIETTFGTKEFKLIVTK